jgi:hypothetical protein
MKSTELRIGNWVEHNQPKRGYYTTVQESTFSVNVEKLFKPIPLTEEWLLKFGFNEVFMVDGVWGHGIDGFIYVNSGQIRFKGKAVLLNENQLQHVHQLQNLYFDLTGEELTIKER